jgi:1-acyl-sn-glycerol-3-phosphate acyltransferase
VMVITPAISLYAIILGMLNRGRELSNRPAKIWSRLMLSALGARIHSHGLENMQTETPTLYLANHQSNADIWVLLSVLPMHTKFVAKESLFKIPLLGGAMRAAGFIPINRESGMRALDSLKLAARRLREGQSLILFPEGTRSRTGTLGRFKSGSFHLALQTEARLVPVVIMGTWSLLQPGSIKGKPGPVEVHFLPPIDSSSFQPKGARELRNHVREQMADALGASTEES